MTHRKWILTIPVGALAILPPAAKAQSDPAWSLQKAIGDPSDFQLSGSVRARIEGLNNQFRPGLRENDRLLSLRTTLLASYDPKPVHVVAEVMDSRAYLGRRDGAVSNGDVNALELIQAYVGFDTQVLAPKLKGSVDIGRFTLDLGSRRLVGRNNFRNATNAFAGLRTQFDTPGKTRITLFYTTPLARLPTEKDAILSNKVEFDRQDFAVAFWGGFVSQPKLSGRIALDAYIFALREHDTDDVPSRDRHITTPGFRAYVEPAPGKTDFEFEAAYQFGEASPSATPDVARRPVRAGLVHAEVGHQFSDAWKSRVSAEFDYASGGHGTRKLTRFDSLFGPRRPDFGPTGIYGPLGRSNLVSPGVRLEVTPSNRWDASLMYRANWLASATDSFASTGVRDSSGASGTFAGHQIEGRVRYWVVPKLLQLDSGAAVLVWGPFLKNAPQSSGESRTLYGYSALTVTF